MSVISTMKDFAYAAEKQTSPITAFDEAYAWKCGMSEQTVGIKGQVWANRQSILCRPT